MTIDIKPGIPPLPEGAVEATPWHNSVSGHVGRYFTTGVVGGSPSILLRRDRTAVYAGETADVLRGPIITRYDRRRRRMKTTECLRNQSLR